METLIQATIGGFISFVFVLILVPIFKMIALKINLTDQPGSRKLHSSPIPLIGGIVIFFSVFFMILVIPIMYSMLMEQFILYVSSVVLFAIGVLDDKFDVPAKYKLMIELLIGYTMASAGFRINSLYGFMGIHELPLIIQYVLTMVVTTGVVNAFNLMDGVDGLVGELSIIGFVILIIFSFLTGHYNYIILYAAFIAATVGFLRFNLTENKIFMGDAGSLWIGYILINSAIYLMNHHTAVVSAQPFLILIVAGFFAVPVLDSLRVYLGRLKKGTSPFKADKTHLHHLLLLMGFSHKRISIIISTLSIGIVLFSIVIYHYLPLTAVILVMIALFCVVGFVLNLNKKLLEWREKLRSMEN
ncbi:MAG TPA: MraY family glycosyltransferase [Bacteroidia bacterium]|nr:MraY family glycosyltransferase [Bacteroidia bacterium]